jgi:hypothetical protein
MSRELPHESVAHASNARETTCGRYIARTGTGQLCKRCLQDRALAGIWALDKRGC